MIEVRPSSSCRDVFCEVRRVSPDARQNGRIERVHASQAQKIEARTGRHAPSLNRLAGLIENRELNPAEIVPESAGPDDGGDRPGRQIELADLVATGPRERRQLFR